MILHYDILDQNRIEFLSLLRSFKEKFYLAGGTGLALQIGHRNSIDFDFFTPDHFDTISFYTDLLDIFKEKKITKTLEDKDSLNIVVNGDFKLSFLRYPYALLDKCIEEENFKVASLNDIACMKLSAITSRATWKDYIDLYFILKQITLSELLEKMRQKMPDLDQNLVLKSMVYFKDVAEEPIMFRSGFDVPRKNVEKFLINQVKNLY